MPTLSTAAALGLLTAAGIPTTTGSRDASSDIRRGVSQPPAPPSEGGGTPESEPEVPPESAERATGPTPLPTESVESDADAVAPEDNGESSESTSADEPPTPTGVVGTDDAPDDATGLPPKAAVDASPAPTAPAEKWIRRHRPDRQTLEVGVFGGVLFPASDLELFATDFDRPQQGFRPYKRFAPEGGVRIGYSPLRALGFEAEGTYAFGALDDDLDAHIWTARGHLVARLPRWRITPFVLAGAGAIGVASQSYAVGRDVDPMLDFGGGVAAHLSRSWLVRLDVRDVLTPSQGNDGGATHTPEVLLGLSWTRRPKTPPPPTRPAGATQPPPPVRVLDTDGDSYADDVDACPATPGGAPDGCPDLDPDDDGVLAPDDACPQQAGLPTDGCPAGDRDGDGFIDPSDACPDEAEIYNEFEDDDGCPDELPADLDAFRGTLEGIQFQIDRARLRESSKRKLDDVAATLLKYANTRVEISGHTDSTGSSAHNHELSQERADAVKAYLAEKGVAPERIETRGAGPDEPIDTNQTREGRAKNRRIEFRLVE